MFGAILKATNSSFQKGMPFCRNIYVKKVMKLLSFIFEQPSYIDGSQDIIFKTHYISFSKDRCCFSKQYILCLVLKGFRFNC